MHLITYLADNYNLCVTCKSISVYWPMYCTYSITSHLVSAEAGLINASSWNECVWDTHQVLVHHGHGLLYCHVQVMLLAVATQR